MTTGVILIRAFQDPELREFLIKICRKRRNELEAEARYGIRL